MTDRRTASTITDEELDALYDERDRIAEAAMQAVRRLVLICGAMPEGLNYYATRIRFAINALRAAANVPLAAAADTAKESA